MAKKKDKDTVSFDETLKEMEGIVERLERDDVSLDDSIQLYEQGICLHKRCSDMLSKARLKIEELTKQADSDQAPGSDSDSDSESEPDEADQDGGDMLF